MLLTKNHAKVGDLARSVATRRPSPYCAEWNTPPLTNAPRQQGRKRGDAGACIGGGKAAVGIDPAGA